MRLFPSAIAFFTSSRNSDDSSPKTIRPLHSTAKIPSTVRFVSFSCMKVSSAVHRPVLAVSPSLFFDTSVSCIWTVRKPPPPRPPLEHLLKFDRIGDGARVWHEMANRSGRARRTSKRKPLRKEVQADCTADEIKHSISLPKRQDI